MTIRDWTRTVALGGVVSVVLTLASVRAGLPTRPVVILAGELRGSGRPSLVLRGDDLRAVSGLALTAPAVPGTYRLHVRVTDAAGCTDATSQSSREVVVR